MEHQQLSSAEISFAPVHRDDTVRRIWKTTIILSVITLIELALGFGLAKDFFGESHGWILFIKGVICILSLAKAVYIVSIFMHLGDEIRNLIMTIVVPLLLFVWFIAAFLWDGDSWRSLRKTYNKGNPAKHEQVAPKPASEGTLK
ncbi:MAG: cytochrome C oxidase subunit IV family protein [Sphingobacteriales bacterium]|nr:cytochrome C oxidase subunit IV family protein [Sphingobacteriales bacterium]